MSIVSGSWALKKWGIDPVLGGNKGQHDQLTPFLRQQLDMLTEARDYALQYSRQNYTKSIVDTAFEQLNRLINQSGQYSTIAEMANALSIFASILDLLESTTRLKQNLYAPRAKDPFPLWTTIYITSRRNAAVKIPFTGGYAGKSSILAYRLPNDVNAEPIPAPEFIDANTIRTPNMSGSFMIYRVTKIPNSVGNEIRDTTVLNDLLRRFHLRTMELGQAFSLVDEYRIREFSGEVITKIEYRDRVIERPVQVIKEVVREIPGPERIVEKIVQVPGEPRYIPTPQQVQSAVTQEISFGDIPKAKSDSALDDDSMVLVLHHRPEQWNDNITYHMARKDTSGNYSTTSPEKWGTGPNLEGLKASRVIYASLDNPPTAETKLRQMIAQGMSDVELGKEYSVDQQRLAPIGWTWRYVLNADINNSALNNPGSPSPAPVPQPNPPQPPIPNPSPNPAPVPSGQWMSISEMSRVIRLATGTNDARPTGWIRNGNINKGGQYRSAAVVQGIQNTWEPSDGWWNNGGGNPIRNHGLLNAKKSTPFETFQNWTVGMENEGNTARNGELFMDLRNMCIFFLYEGSDEWWLFDRNNHVGWASRFNWNMGDSGGGNLPVQQFNGYCRVPIPVGNTDATGIYHGGTGDLDMAPAYRRGKIRGILVTAEARISPSSPNGSRAAFQMGGDWKWRNDGAILAWYPGFGLSATTQLSKEWQRFYHCALRPGPDVSRESRALSVDAFRRTRIPLPDMGSSTQTSPPRANPWPDQPPAPPPPTDSRTFASLRGRHNMLHIKQTPDQKGENRWIVEWLGIENGKVMDNSIVEKDAAMLASREWVGTKTIPAIVWTSNQPLPNDLSDYLMTTLTADRSSFNSVAPYYDIGIWRDNATVANTEEGRKK